MGDVLLQYCYYVFPCYYSQEEWECVTSTILLLFLLLLMFAAIVCYLVWGGMNWGCVIVSYCVTAKVGIRECGVFFSITVLLSYLLTVSRLYCLLCYCYYRDIYGEQGMKGKVVCSAQKLCTSLHRSSEHCTVYN